MRNRTETGSGSNPKDHRQSSTKIGDYGCFLWNEQKKAGFYRFQTDHKPLIDLMKVRGWDEKSPWRTIGWGTSYIFKRRFAGSFEAKRSISKILEKIGIKNVEFRKLESGGFEVLKAPNPIPSYAYRMKQPKRVQKHRETPLMTGSFEEPRSYCTPQALSDGGGQK